MLKGPRSLGKVAAWGVLIKLLGVAFAFALSVLLTRTLGIEEFGMYSMVISLIMVSSIPIQSGIPVLTTRELSKAVVNKDNEAIHRFMQWSSKVIFIYASGALLVCTSLYLLFISSALVEGILIASASFFTLSVTLRNSAALRGLGEFTKSFYPESLVRPAVQLVVVAIFWSITRNTSFSAQLAVAGFVAGSMFALWVSQYWLKKHLPRDFKSSPKPLQQAGKWRKAAILLTIAGGGQILFGHIDTLMLGALSTSTDVGAYKVAVQISMLLTLVPAVVNQTIQPKIARLFTKNSTLELQQIVAKASSVTFLTTLAPALIIIAFAGEILQLIFGEPYQIATVALQVLITGQLVNVLFGSVGTILHMTGLEKESMIAISMAIALNIILDAIFIPYWANNGAATASAISLVTWNIICRYFIKINMNIESSGIVHTLKQNIYKKRN